MIMTLSTRLILLLNEEKVEIDETRAAAGRVLRQNACDGASMPSCLAALKPEPPLTTSTPIRAFGRPNATKMLFSPFRLRPHHHAAAALPCPTRPLHNP